MFFTNFPIKKYDIIVVDPPWDVKKLARRVRPKQVYMDYKTLSTEEIKLLPVPMISHPCSLLFLWAPQKFLFESRGVLEYWGFKYLLTMVWEKTYGKSNGMPLYGFRWNGEFCLVGYKTKPVLWPKRSLIPVVFRAENIRHSQKPDKFYEMIWPLGVSKVDLFARQQRSGWDTWGNEIPNMFQEATYVGRAAY